MGIAKDIRSLVGFTPLLEASRYSRETGAQDARILAKVEYFNPTGSVKDRAALEMIEDAERRGELQKGGTIIEPTSGNTGIGIAAFASVRGYRAILTMPESMSEERRRLLRAYGAEIVLTDAGRGMTGAVERAEELRREIPGSVVLGQFDNRANAVSHLKTTGPEIWKDTDGRVDIFVSAVGTGGTLTGTAEYLKGKNPALKVVAVEPAGSPVLSRGKGGPHKIQGIGAGFVPSVLNRDLIDEVVAVTDADAFEEARRFARSEGLLVGISSGAALKGAAMLASREENRGAVIVVILPDSGDRYFSTALFTE